MEGITMTNTKTQPTLIDKKTSHAFGKDVFLLGKDQDGIAYWLQEGKFDCDWYWGLGYVETFTTNNSPSTSRDISSHSHFDSMFFKKDKNGYDEIKEFFTEVTFTNNELWKLLELMKTLYTLKEYSDTIYRGGSHYTTNPLKDLIKNDAEYERINKTVIPALLQEVYKLLTP